MALIYKGTATILMKQCVASMITNSTSIRDGSDTHSTMCLGLEKEKEKALEKCSRRSAEEHEDSEEPKPNYRVRSLFSRVASAALRGTLDDTDTHMNFIISPNFKCENCVWHIHIIY